MAVDLMSLTEAEADVATDAVILFRNAEVARAADAARRATVSRIGLDLSDLDSEDADPRVWGIQQHLDLTEGRKGSIRRGVFVLREDAEVASKLLAGVFGSENVLPVEPQILFGSVDGWLFEMPREQLNTKAVEAYRAAQ